MILLSKTSITAIILLGTLAACSPSSKSVNSGVSTLNWEAGKAIDEGNFGNPTYNNILVQTAYSDQNGLMLDLSRKFEKDVPTMINFAFNSARLDAEARNILTEQASWIKQFPEIKFRVYGHTDLVGTAKYNQRLGLRRANAAVNFLISQGIKSDRLEAVASFGETQPLIVTQGRERKNRRTVTDVIGFARNFVGDGLDGKYAELIYREYVGDKIVTDTANLTK
ncbi:MAG: OmpA family protein [Alphaproteobacteria bacterium]|nr:OmpA family protein [Alphaproteobacteria bacterium]